nr:MAG TPA: hypothetical protein [Caudoviricetes sp.]
MFSLIRLLLRRHHQLLREYLQVVLSSEWLLMHLLQNFLKHQNV